jgi:hypothetical protein
MNRMEKHVQIIGILYIVLGCLGIVPGAIAFTALAGAGILSGDAQALAITGGIGTAVALFLFTVSVPGIVGGTYLLKRREWARVMVLVLGFLNLLSIPFGTALGVYTIWALMRDETRPLFHPAA